MNIGRFELHPWTDSPLKREIVKKTKELVEEHGLMPDYELAFAHYLAEDWEAYSDTMTKMEGVFHKDFGYYDADMAHAAYQMRNLIHNAIVWEAEKLEGGE